MKKLFPCGWNHMKKSKVMIPSIRHYSKPNQSRREFRKYIFLAFPITWGILVFHQYYFSEDALWRATRETEDANLKDYEVRYDETNQPKVGGSFTLVESQSGRPVTDSEYRGRYMMVYFGFCNCPDVCPSECEKITKALYIVEKQRPELLKYIQPLYISLDPMRDDRKLMNEFLSDYHEKFIGLVGTPEQIGKAARKYRVYYSSPDYENDPEDYGVDHSVYIYVMDGRGYLRDFFPEDKTAEELAHALITMVGEDLSRKDD